MKQETNALLDLVRHGLAAKNQSVVDSAQSVKSLCVYYLTEWFIEMDEEPQMSLHVEQLQKYTESPSDFPIDIVDEDDDDPEPTYA